MSKASFSHFVDTSDDNNYLTRVARREKERIPALGACIRIQSGTCVGPNWPSAHCTGDGPGRVHLFGF